MHLRGFVLFLFFDFGFCVEKIILQTEPLRVIIESCEIDNEKSSTEKREKKERNKQKYSVIHSIFSIICTIFLFI